jgi:AcrR family transcriptional regulator
MTRQTTPSEDHRADTRAAIFGAAQHLAARAGRFTILDIARTAGVSHTTVYNHFESRQHVLEVLAARWTNDTLDAAHRASMTIETNDAAMRLHTLMINLYRLKWQIAGSVSRPWVPRCG